MCGGLNVNLLKAVVADMKKWVEQDVETTCASLATRASNSLEHMADESWLQLRILGSPQRSRI